MTFFAVGEWLNFFSASFPHKIVNIFITLFFYIILFVAVGGILWFRFRNKSNISYLLENSRNCFCGLASSIIDHGLVCVLLGAIHRVTMNHPNLQLFFLSIIEISWLLIKLKFLIGGIYRLVVPEWIMQCSGLLRICFLLTFYFYSTTDQRLLINDGIQSTMVVLFIVLWFN